MVGAGWWGGVCRAGGFSVACRVSIGNLVASQHVFLCRRAGGDLIGCLRCRHAWPFRKEAMVLLVFLLIAFN